MFGSAESFRYIGCAECGCLQIADTPERLEELYRNGYYSMATRRRGASSRRLVRRLMGQYWVGEARGPLSAIVPLMGLPAPLEWVTRAGKGLDASILDVGCGSGALLLVLRDYGFRQLLGSDPFIDHDLHYGDGLKILKRRTRELSGRFDLIMMNHTIEHVPDPLSDLRQLRDLLAPDGCLLVRTPLAGTFAWRHYGADWVQLDPPRHLYVHTRESLGRLAAAAGLLPLAVEFDSTEFQFLGSELCRLGIPIASRRSTELPPFLRDRRRIQTWRTLAKLLNAAGDGDQACFYLRRRSDVSDTPEPEHAKSVDHPRSGRI